MINGSVIVRRRVRVSVRGLNRSVTVCREVGGFRRGLNRSVVVRRRVRGSRFKGRGFYIGLYSRLLYF